MSKAFDRFGISEDQLQQMINDNAQVDAGLNRLMAEVVAYWKSISPVRTGKYAASVKITKKARNGRGEVGATDFKAHWVEDGTNGIRESAPGQKTAAHFGGTLERGKSAE